MGPPVALRSTRRPRRRWRLVLPALLVTVLLGSSAVWTNAFGAGERFENLLQRVELAIDPPPDRPTRQTVAVTPRASPTATASPTTMAPAETEPAETERLSTPAPTPTPAPVRKPVSMSILKDPDSVFASQITKDWCAPAGTQMALTILGLGDRSEAFQRQLVGRIDEWESWQDSHNGGWGPAAIAEALAAYGAPDYEIRAYDSREDALFDAALALSTTRRPVVLIAWRGAHTWVMTGYRADADPRIFPDARVTGAFILDPWYPRVSSIWGPSDPPGTFQDAAEMERNYLPWKRPEGAYPERDGKFIVLVPTIAR
jgi:hypothetical protein